MAAPTRGAATRFRSGTMTNDIDISVVPVGGWMLIGVHMGNATTAITPPSGWTVLTPRQTTGTRSVQLFARIKASSAETVASIPSAANLTRNAWLMWGEGAKAVSEWTVGLIGVRSGSNVVSGVSVQAGDGTHSVAPSITTDDPDTLIISFITEATTTTEPTFVPAPVGATLWAYGGFADSFTDTEVMTYATRATAGATDAVSVEYPNSQTSNGSGTQIGIPAAAVTPPTPMGVPVKKGDGSTAYLSYLDGSGVRRAPASVKLLLPGFASVDQMLATPGATWAHRGGSANFPEMSEYAYDQSSLRRYGALEFSTQRTSDAWWFGLHDNSLERTSPGAGSAAPSTYTRAQIEALLNSLNASGHPRPYYGLIDFLDKYTPHRVVIVDPKNALVAHNSELLDILDAHGGPEKIIWKFSGGGANASAGSLAARARGYETWGYFYATQASAGLGGNGELQLRGGDYTILGMEYGASQAVWDEVLAFNKPTVAHIAQTQANYDTGISKGADMVQCANVLGITAVGPVA